MGGALTRTRIRTRQANHSFASTSRGSMPGRTQGLNGEDGERGEREPTNGPILFIAVFPRGCRVRGADTAKPLKASRSAGEQDWQATCSNPHFWARARHNRCLKVSVRSKQDSSGGWDFPFSSPETFHSVRAFKEGFQTGKSRQVE